MQADKPCPVEGRELPAYESDYYLVTLNLFQGLHNNARVYEMPKQVRHDSSGMKTDKKPCWNH